MKNTFITILLITIIVSFAVPQKAEAANAGTFAALVAQKSATIVQDARAKALQAYLQSKGSPLAANSQDFVNEADKNNLDWRLVAAISGVESGFGRAYPIGTYNGWGWGIYGTHTHYFVSWKDAIKTISAGLRINYIDKWGARDVYGIGHSYAADPNWAYKVTNYMNEIDTFATNYQNKSLPISL